MPRLGFQMITLNSHSDFAGALGKARQMGYRIAEPYGWKPPVSCPEQHRLGEQAGLKICSGHYNPSSEWVRDHVEELADQLAAAGARAWTMPGGFTGPTLDDMKAGADKLNAFYEKTLKPRGLKVEYHNHSKDIVPLFDGKTQVDVLLELVPDLGFQPDIGNAYLGGQTDTLAFLRHYQDRITCLHLKDIRKDHASIDHGQGNCPTGHGIVDIKGAIDFALSIGIQDFIIEQEGAIDDHAIERILQESYNFVKPLL